MTFCRFFVVTAVCLLPSFSQTAGIAGCTDCHDQTKKVKASAHASVACASCHEKHETYPHASGLAKPKCASCHAGEAGEHARSVHGLAIKAGNTAAPDCGVCHGAAHETANARASAFRSRVPETCGMCHDKIAEQYKASVHGAALQKGINEAPVCIDCHGEHGILAHGNPNSPVNASNIRTTCGNCHANVRLAKQFGMPTDRVVSFDASFHGLASAAGSQTVANCASCHGVHNIKASSDPQSTIHPNNLRQTCGKCHPGAGTRFALGPIHLWPGRTEPKSVRMVRQTYMLLIPLLIGLMLLHNGGDWLRKLRRLRLSGKPVQKKASALMGYQSLRMLPFERVLHAMLLVSFVTLAWTGFQLKYPEEWWAKPMLNWEARWSLRGVVHRSAAVLFMLAGLMHVVSLIVNPKLRHHWKQLLPRYTDVMEAWRSFAYSVGLSSKKPVLSPYSFMEKAEYWAVVWGAVIMGLTGILLWADNVTLRLLPKELLDLATALHYYEAILACLAIVVWHLYLVIFDPEVYPVDTAFVTGYSVRDHHHEDEPEVSTASR